METNENIKIAEIQAKSNEKIARLRAKTDKEIAEIHKQVDKEIALIHAGLYYSELQGEESADTPESEKEQY